MMRGVKKSQASMTTSTMVGAFQENQSLRAEFIAHINRTRNDN
jgi:GTP cyclohydrolase I